MNTNNPMSNIPPLGQPTAMMPGMAQSKFKPVDPMRVILGSWPWILIAAIIGAGTGFGIWYGLDKYKKRYTSMTQFEVQATRNDPTGITSVRLADLLPVIEREVQSVRSEPTLRQTINNPTVQNTVWFQSFNNDLDAAYRNLSQAVSSSAIKGAPLFNVRAETPNRDDAQIILTALNQEYMRRQNERIDITFSRDLQAAQKRLDTVEEKITRMRGEIKRFLNNTTLDSLTEGSTQASIRSRTLITKIDSLTDSLNSIEATTNELNQRLQAADFTPTDDERQQIENRPVIQGIDSQIRQLRVSKEPLLERLAPNHQAIKQIDTQILLLEREKKQTIDEMSRLLFDAKLEQASLSRQVLVDALADAREEEIEVNAQRQDFVRLQQEYQVLTRELTQAESERVEAVRSVEDLRQLREAEAWVVVRETVPPQQAKQSFPPSPLIMVFGIGALFGALVTGLFFLREVFDQRLRSAADIKLVPDLSLVGTVPSSDEDPGGSHKIERVVEQHPSGLVAEAFRQVRTTVLSKIDRRGYKTLMTVAAKPGAGVSTTSQNLAASCALTGRKVLMIDANFRRPALASIMGQSSQPGLAELLRGEITPENAVEVVQHTETEGLALLPAGNSLNAAVELFESPRFRELLARLEAAYDLIIIDTPPALLTSDAQLLSRHVDALLIISRSGVDTRGMLERLYRELDGQRADILGVVLNGVQAAAGGYLKRNYKEFHAYSGPERRKNARTQNGKGNSARVAVESPAPAVLEEGDQPEDINPFDDLDINDQDDDRR